MESQNAERRQTGENQNEEESNSQANKWDRTSGEDSTMVENELCNMRKEMDELKSAMEDKSRGNLDGMIWRTDSPLPNEVLNCSFPPKFCPPQSESYNGSKDPLDHIESKMLILLQMTPDEVICRAVLTTLKGAARVWFSKIPPGTIAEFKQLSNGFFRHFIRGQRHKKPIGHLLNIQ